MMDSERKEGPGRIGSEFSYRTAEALDWAMLDGVRTLGITAGASAPEVLVEALLDRLRQRYTLKIEERVVTTEDVVFKLPAELAK